MFNLDPSLLAKLQLSAADLVHLSQDEQKKKIRSAYLKLAFKYHPDKSGANQENKPNEEQSAQEKSKEQLFTEITTAYEAITKKEADYSHEINEYYTAVAFNLPDTAFDLLLRERIINVYNSLLDDFRILSSPSDKQVFATQHAVFISLAQQLIQERSRLDAQLGKYFAEQMEESLWQKYQHEWRKLMITLFAEEFLDDFQYRHAIATGELSAIFALRKLLSPVKLVVALVNSIILGITTLGNYLFIHKVTKPIIDELNRYDKDEASKGAVAWAIAKMIGLVVFFTLTCLVFPLPTILLLSTPLIANLLTIIACPINQLIRPLAQWMGLSPYLVNAALASLLGVSTFLFISFFPVAVLPLLLYMMSIALTLYGIYGTVTLIKKVYEVNRPAAIITLVFFVTAVVMGALSYILPVLVPDPLFDFLSNLINAIFIYQGNKAFDNATQDIAEKTELLPLPEEEISEHIKEAVLQQVKTGHYSLKFFNTPKEASIIPSEKRTPWQQAASFFGGGESFLVKEEKLATAKSSALPILALTN